MLANGNVRFALALCLALLASAVGGRAGSTENSAPWIATATIMRDGGSAGAGVYLGSGLILTAAHLTDANAKMGVHIAGMALPAELLKQGVLEDVDLSLLRIDEEKLPESVRQVRTQLCAAPPWPGDPVIVVDAANATRSRIVAPQVLPFTLRSKFSTLIADVATTGNSGSGVFDPNHKCLLGIMSQKLVGSGPKGEKDLAKYFVPAAAIRDFMPTEIKP
jgi:hypothetical protein